MVNRSKKYFFLTPVLPLQALWTEGTQTDIFPELDNSHIGRSECEPQGSEIMRMIHNIKIAVFSISRIYNIGRNSIPTKKRRKKRSITMSICGLQSTFFISHERNFTSYGHGIIFTPDYQWLHQAYGHKISLAIDGGITNPRRHISCRLLPHIIYGNWLSSSAH